MVKSIGKFQFTDAERLEQFSSRNPDDLRFERLVRQYRGQAVEGRFDNLFGGPAQRHEITYHINGRATRTTVGICPPFHLEKRRVACHRRNPHSPYESVENI